MSHYWGSFIRSGDPNRPSHHLTNWRDLRSSTVLSLRPSGQSTRISVTEYRAQHHCDFWDA
jgi:hypothetical protein